MHYHERKATTTMGWVVFESANADAGADADSDADAKVEADGRMNDEDGKEVIGLLVQAEAVGKVWVPCWLFGRASQSHVPVPWT